MHKTSLTIFIVIACLLVTACGGTAEPTAQALPTESPTPSPVPTLQASPLPTLQPSITPEPDVTPTATGVPIDPLIEEEVPPPLTLDLPDGWQFAYNVRIFNDVGDLRIVPFAFYTGPVTGGTGFIVLLWDFPNATNGNPFLSEGLQPNLYVDGLRLLRLLILEQDCVIGTDLQMEYNVGGRVGAGTQFSTSNCPELPDTRGWFVGVFEQNVPFIFYVYTDPISAMDGVAQTELQRILDSVQFNLVKEGE